MIPWFSPNAHKYLINELNEQMISVNLQGITNIKYIKNKRDALSTMDDIKEMARNAEQAEKCKIEMRQKMNKIKENSDEREGKMNKQSKDGKMNGTNSNNNKPNPCWIEGHNHD